MAHGRNPIARLWTGFWQLISWLRVATLNLLFLFIAVVVLTAVFAPEGRPVPERGPLVLMPSGYLVDQKAYQSPAALLLESDTRLPAETVVRDLVDSIEAAAADEDVTALVLDLGYLAGGALSKLEEVGQALRAFKATDKPIIAYGDSFSQPQYYLASYADEIYLNEMGAVLLNGFGMYRHYMHEAVEKLDVNVHVFRVGEYKDFVEPFTRNSMSSASRQHNSRWINELWGVYTSRIESARQLPSGAIDDLINNMDSHLTAVGGDTAELALQHGLVDKLLSRVGMRQMLMSRFGANAEGDSFAGIPHFDYLARQRRGHLPQQDRIGLIVATGTIMEGDHPKGNIGSDTLARLIRSARTEEDIKAVVLRVDSGGGSALASEIIREELAAVRASGKPLIVSMGSVAASGGYWISAPADEIWATPTTLTGSIGVFALSPTFERTLENLGIHTDGIGTTDLASADRIDTAMSAEAAQVAQARVESIYRRFLEVVANAREMAPESVHEVGQGRVWTGATAAELGLVDKLGYLEDAIASAAQKAGLAEYSVQLVERELTPTEQLLRVLRGEAQAALTDVQQTFLRAFTQGGTSAAAPLNGVFAETTALARFYQQLRETLSPLVAGKANGVYAQCLQCAEL